MTPAELLIAMGAEAAGHELETMVAIANGDDLWVRFCEPGEDAFDVIVQVPRPGPEVIGVRSTASATAPGHAPDTKTTITTVMSLDDQITQITWSDTGAVRLIDERPTGRIADAIDWSLNKKVLP